MPRTRGTLTTSTEAVALGRALIVRLAMGLMPLGLAAGLFACAPAAKGETAALAGAVDRFRRADNASKADLASATAAVSCSDSAVCAARDACVAAMGPTAKALVMKDHVARKLDEIEHGKLPADSPEARGLAAELDQAEKLLQDGRIKWSSCERSLSELRVEYGV